jgi:glycosyltransferase involved in cell wall biosynthesis
MISVIIPTYNYARYLMETLLSVSNQSYANWECIIIDDGSTDNTREVVDNFIKADVRFKYIYQQNKGVSSARNVGIKASTGDFIQFLDGDDLLQPDKLNNQLNYLIDYSSVDIVYSNFQHFNDGENPIYIHGEYLQKNKISLCGQNLIRLFLKGNFIRMNTPLIRKTVISDVGFFNENFISIEDWDFWLRCACKGKQFAFQETKNANAFVRVHSNGLSKNLITMKKFYLPVLQHTFANEKLNFSNNIILLSRYSVVLLDSFFKSDNQLIISNEKKLAFSVLAFGYSVLFFPFYFIIKVYNLIRK